MTTHRSPFDMTRTTSRPPAYRPTSRTPAHRPTSAARPGFTLVEIMVVVVIIGILTALVVPATMRAITRARDTEAKMEVAAIADAVDQYHLKYGDFPPDGSDFQVLVRHMRKITNNRIGQPDLALLQTLTHPDGSNFSPVAMDRAEALVLFLGGFSSDLVHPLTGPGGPLEFKNYSGDDNPLNLANYQYNATRDNAFFEFKPERLTIALQGNRYVSTDEVEMGYNDVNHGGQDLLPAYRSTRTNSPIVYFDSRTYGEVAPGFYNAYRTPGEFGGLRPYKTSVGAQPPPYANPQAAFAAVKFHNPQTYQVISPGGDGVYGAVLENASAQPIHFVTETGSAIIPNTGASSIQELGQTGLGIINGFQDQQFNAAVTVNGHLDNVTNFSSSTLESDLP